MLTPVLIFAKPWLPGIAKTRLAERVGSDWAAELAKAMFLDTWAKVRAAPGVKPVLLTTDPRFDHGVEGELWPQGEGDLGERLERGFVEALRNHSTAIALGADCPAMPIERLSEATAALQSHEAVIGPATDGGYYLLGLNTCQPGLLEDLPWSSPRTHRATLARFEERGMATALLPPASDIDDFGDLQELLRDVQACDCPRTYSAAAQLCAEIQAKVPSGSST